MKVAVIFSGCGVRDGSEIHEAVSLLLALDQKGHKAQCFAPSIMQAQVIDHATGQPSNTQRNVLSESARIARGRIRPLDDLDPSQMDAIALPGGLGAVTNLCNFASNGTHCTVEKCVEEKLRSAHKRLLPLGFMCISPMLCARLFGNEHILLTIGDDPSSIASLEAMGAKHLVCPPTKACIDTKHRIASTPAYMSAHSLSEVFQSALALVDALASLHNNDPEPFDLKSN